MLLGAALGFVPALLLAPHGPYISQGSRPNHLTTGVLASISHRRCGPIGGISSYLVHGSVLIPRASVTALGTARGERASRP